MLRSFSVDYLNPSSCATAILVVAAPVVWAEEGTANRSGHRLLRVDTNSGDAERHFVHTYWREFNFLYTCGESYSCLSLAVHFVTSVRSKFSLSRPLHIVCMGLRHWASVCAMFQKVIAQAPPDWPV